MSLQIRIFSIIVALAILTIAVGGGSGTFLMRMNLTQSESDNLSIIADLAESLISSRVELMKLGARKVAAHIKQTTDEHLEEILNTYGDINLDGEIDFIALAVIEKVVSDDGKEKFVLVASTGEYPIPDSLLLRKPPSVIRTFAGESVGSSTIRVESNLGGEPKLVFLNCVPMTQTPEGEVTHVLCTTVDGMYCADLLDHFRVWNKEGNIVLCDSEGTVIASIYREDVTEQANYINIAKKHPDSQSVADFTRLMISGESGHHTYHRFGQPRVGYFRPVFSSARGWALAVTAPAVSSPHRKTLWWVGLMTLFCLILVSIIAFFASGFLVKPYHEAFHAKELAEKASESKSTFLTNMSHEMRTPLNAIIGLSELTLGSEEAKGEVAVNLEKIYHSGVTLLGTINDLLDISKIESGKLELVPGEYDMPSLINDTAALNSVRIGSKPIRFTIDVDENMPCRFFGDELRIKQMLNNLLSNAFKYTREGQVNWSIIGKQEGDDFFIVFKVTDTGIGIRQEDMSALFKEYHQLDSKANRKIEGTGLGLALVRKMARLMGGVVTVESEYGRGSTFTLRIQQKPLTDEPIGKDVAFNLTHMRFIQSKLAKNARLARLKIPYARVLVVDDVPTNLDVARGMLKPYEMQVDCVTGGQQAIDAVRNETVRYNAIFMDHMMPGMDGIEAAQRIRELGTEYAKTVPIIALTANAIVGNEEMFLQKGFQAFLSKPIDIMRLDVEIRRWVRDRALEAALNLGMGSSPRVVEEDAQPAWTIEGINKEKALEQFGGNEETLLIILQSFTIHTPDLLNQIRTCTESQLKDYALVVHGIKGSCYGICADVVGKQAEALEHAARQGNFQYVSEHNAAFIRAAEELMAHINMSLQTVQMIAP